MERLAGELGIGLGQLAAPLRVALTGGTVSPGLGETFAVLGRQSVRARILRALSAALGPAGATA